MTATTSALRRPLLRGIGLTAAIALSAALSGLLIGHAVSLVAGNRMAPWVLGRAAGICAYLLLVGLVLLGLGLSHPWRTRVRRPSSAARIRAHIVLAVFTLVFTALHIVVLATDRYAGVGSWGTLLPLRASYRPVAVTLGLIGLWSGLLAGLTAAFAGRLPLRAWWPIHKVAIGSLVLIWAHGVLAGGDTPALLWLYVGSAALVVGVAATRYGARTPADRRGALR